MAAFIDEDMNSPHINTFVFNVSTENFEYLAVIPTSFARNGRSSSCIDGSETLFLESLSVQVSLYYQSSKIPPGRLVSKNLNFWHFPVA